MRSNGLLKWLMLPVVGLLLFFGIRLFSGGDDPPHPRAAADTQLTPEEMQALGIEGDTPRDTVATLVAQVKQLRTELQTSMTDNKAQREENQRLRQREGAIDQRISTALESERTALRHDQERVAGERQQTEGLLQDLQRQLENIRGGDHTDLPVGLGLREGDADGFAGGGGIHWVEPDDAREPDTRNGKSSSLSFPTSFGPAQKTLETTPEQVADAGAKAAGVKTARPVYTVPTNATLMGSVAMTALIGRIPIDGTVNDPFPFKVLVGPDNLTANGIDIPDVAGAVFSGTASGDWTLSCVRGQVRSITFVFHDGTIRTIPEGSNNGDHQDNTKNNQSGGLGWISDPFGIPCVSGERRSNAQQYLGTQALITAAGAGAASLIDADSGQTSYVGADGSIGTVGITGNEAMGHILSGGVQDMSQWVNKLYGQAFAAVYVQPGARVAVHLEAPLEIDYAREGRRVDHRAGESHVLDLD